MRLPFPLRRRPALWLMIPAAPLLMIVGNLSRTSSPIAGYWTWTVSHSVLLIMVPAAVAATGAALEAARLRTHRQEAALNLRPAWMVILDAIWPSYVCAVIIQLCALAIVSVSAWGGSSRFPWEIFGAVSSILLFHTSTGFLLGAALRPVVSIPLALAFSYTWLGFTGAIDWFAPRHLAGLIIESCCFYDEQPNPTSLAATAVFSILGASALLCAASAVLRLWSPRPPLNIVTPTLLMALAAFSGLMLANGLPSTATEPRNPAELTCSTAEVTVCLYPEQLTDESPIATIQSMVLRVRDAGVSLPNRVVASRQAASAAALTVRYRPDMSNAQIAGSLASGLQGEQYLDCGKEPVDRVIKRQGAADIARAWIELRMSEEGELARESTFAELPELRSLMTADESQQVEWINRALASMNSCADNPPAVPTQ